MSQPMGERRVQREVITTTTTRGPDHDRRKAAAWAKGLGAVAAVGTLISAGVNLPRIQNDLKDKVEAAAAAQGQNVTAKFSGQDGTITCGGPIDEATVAAIGDSIKGVHGDLKFDESCTAAPAPEPAPETTVAVVTPPPAPVTEPAPETTAAPVVSQLNAMAILERGAAGVVLKGVVDTEAQRTSLVAAATAAFGDGNVTDELTVAGIEGAGSDPHVDGLGKLINGMRDNVVEGEAGFNGKALYVRGTYPDDNAKANLDGVIGDAGVEAANVDLSIDAATTPAPAATFDAEAGLDADGKVTLTGVVPNEAARAALVAAAAERAGGPENVVDQLTIADPAAADDPGVGRLAKMVGAMPPNLYIGKVGWDGLKFYASGQYLSEEKKAAFEAVAAEVGVAAADLAVEPRPDATADEAAALEKELNDLVAVSPIPFDQSKSTLKPEADAILDKVTALAKKYAGVTIAVNGHTDADGSDASNQKLSEDRANRVRDALIERGVPAEQLTAQGFGESQPVAANDTPENKAKNRRVVFAVAKQ